MTQREAPERIEPKSLGDYLEVMSKSVFQTGISWRVVNSKWPDIREALRDFDAEAVAVLGDDDIEALVQDTRVIRNRRKLQAIVGNARRLIDLDDEHGSFKDYLRSHDDYDATVKDLRKQFKYLGEMGCYVFLYAVGEEVPPYEEWRQRTGR
jgi:DNA-3-methyladenine glycosylase I